MLATLNAAEYHNFHHLGQLAPGYQADVLAFDSLDDVAPAQRVAARPARRGRRRDRSATPCRAPPRPIGCSRSVHLAIGPTPTTSISRRLPGGRARVIGLVEATDHHRPPRRRRHRSRSSTSPASRCSNATTQTGRIGLGWVSGFGLVRGAIASTVAHDAHNCMVVGARGRRPVRTRWPWPWRGSPRSAAARSRCSTAACIAEVPLPIGGLMSPLPAREVADLTERAKDVVHRDARRHASRRRSCTSRSSACR